MKRIILSVIVMAFAVAVHAGDSTSCQNKDKAACGGCKAKTSVQAQTNQDADKNAPSCCAGKVKTSLEAQTNQDPDKEAPSCCAGKMKTSVEAKGACCKQGQAKLSAGKRNVLMSPKAVSLASN
jgi:hypothetical protein